MWSLQVVFSFHGGRGGAGGIGGRKYKPIRQGCGPLPALQAEFTLITHGCVGVGGGGGVGVLVL